MGKVITGYIDEMILDVCSCCSCTHPILSGFASCWEEESCVHVEIEDAMMFGNITKNLGGDIEKVTRSSVWVGYPYGFIKS